MNTDLLCVFIASHISNEKRIKYLKECLNSLINQTVQIHIYLSISFANDELLNFFNKEVADITNFEKLFIFKTLKIIQFIL